MPSLYLDPNGTINSEWSQRDATRIDDGVRDPTNPASSGDGQRCEAQDKGDSSAIQQWSTGNIPSTADATANTYRLYYADTGDSSITSGRLRINNVWTTVNTTSNGGSGGGWKYYEWTGRSDDISSGLSNMGFHLAVGSLSNGDFHAVYAAYIEVIYTVTTTTTTAAPGGGEDNGNKGKFLLFLDT